MFFKEIVENNLRSSLPPHQKFVSEVFFKFNPPFFCLWKFIYAHYNFGVGVYELLFCAMIVLRQFIISFLTIYPALSRKLRNFYEDK